MELLTLGIIIFSLIIFRRYAPVYGLQQIHWEQLGSETAIIIDLRDYNESYLNTVSEAINIPIAYLNRYYHEIPKKNLYIVASNNMEKNIGVRFLRKKGFQVIGYSIKNHVLPMNETGRNVKTN